MARRSTMVAVLAVVVSSAVASFGASGRPFGDMRVFAYVPSPGHLTHHTDVSAYG